MTGSGLDDVVDGLLAPEAAVEVGVTLAMLVERSGSTVLERYGPDTDATTPLISWSMAKTITGALVGIAVAEGRLDLDAPAPVPEWAADERSAITVRHLMQMRSGLDFEEDYVDERVSHVIEMLFGSGRADVAGYAASRPLAHRPGSVWNYSSGETNIIARVLRDIVGGPDAFARWSRQVLLDPLGLDSMTLRTDEAGTFVGSSFADATARDYARFGRFLLDDGCVGERRLLPEGFVAEMTRSQAVDAETGQGYGLQTWTTPDGRGTFSANGYEGQYIICVPSIDAVVVRLGKTPAERKDALRARLDDVIEAIERDG